jgi:hypothetical protein
MRALIAARDLVRASSLRKNSDVNMLYVGARHRERDKILGLTRGRTGMTANATRMIDDLGPLHRAVWWFFEHASSGYRIFARANYITPTRKENTRLSTEQGRSLRASNHALVYSKVTAGSQRMAAIDKSTSA